jgi:hypothetical protein
MDEPQTLSAVDDERGRPGDVEGGQAEAVIHTIAFDHRAVWIDQDREAEGTGPMVGGYFRLTLADDDQELGSKAAVGRDIGLQLLQLLAAVRSPGAADEHDQSCAGG